MLIILRLFFSIAKSFERAEAERNAQKRSAHAKTKKFQCSDKGYRSQTTIRKATIFECKLLPLDYIFFLEACG